MAGNVFSIGNANADIVNIGGAATDVNLGSSVGVVNLVGNLKLSNNSLITVDDQTVMSWTAGATADVTFDDNVTIGGTLTIAGATVFASGVSTADLLVIVAKDAANVAATNGAGIKVDVANATILYNALDDQWESNKDLVLGSKNIQGNLIAGNSISASTGITGTIQTASQPNINEIGALTRADITLIEHSGDMFFRSASGSNGNLQIRTDGTGVIDFVNSSIIRPKFVNYRELITTITDHSGDFTPDWSTGAVYYITLADNITFNQPANIPTGGSMTFIIRQDSVGGRTATWDALYRFAFGSKTLSTGPNDIDVVSIFNQGSFYLASLTKNYS